VLPIRHLVQVAAGVTDQHVQRVALVLSQEIAGEEVERFAATAAIVLLHPEEIFDMCLIGAALEASGAVESADLLLHGRHQPGGGSAIGGQVQVFDLPVNDPPCHGVDVISQHVAPDPVGLDERGSAPHERIGNGDPLEVVSREERLLERPVAVLGEEQPPEQGPRPTCEPLVHGDDRPVVLLDLFFPQGQGGDERDVEVRFYGHGDLISLLGADVAATTQTRQSREYVFVLLIDLRYAVLCQFSIHPAI